MFRLLIGIVVGWLAARWYYLTEVESNRMVARHQTRSLGNRARDVVQETGEVARELGEESKIAARMGKSSLEEKAERVRKTAAE